MSKDNLVELYPQEPNPTGFITCSDCGQQEWIIHTKPGSTAEEFAIDFLECSNPDCGECVTLDFVMMIEPEEEEEKEQ